MNKREILFRGRTEYNKWVEGSLVIDAFGNHFIYAFALSKSGQSQEENRYSVVPETVGQYVALDDTGERMFEGDIKGPDGVLTCFPSSGKFCWNYGNGLPVDEISPYDIVAGNIYDHPHLLNKKK